MGGVRISYILTPFSLISEYSPRIPKRSLFRRITAEVCLLALRQPAGVKIEALGSYNEDTKIPRYQDTKIGWILALLHKLQFGTLTMFSAGFDAVDTSGTTLKLQVSLYSTPEAFCGKILAF